MTNLTTMLIVGFLPFAALALASLSESFRIVLKSVFTSGNTVAAAATTEDVGEPVNSFSAAELLKLIDPAKSGFRVSAAQASESLAKVTVNNNELVITIIESRIERARGKNEHRVGKHAGAVSAKGAE